MLDIHFVWLPLHSGIVNDKIRHFLLLFSFVMLRRLRKLYKKSKDLKNTRMLTLKHQNNDELSFVYVPQKIVKTNYKLLHFPPFIDVSPFGTLTFIKKIFIKKHQNN